ncbi:hypothetical protein B0H14DRAFT_2658258 [Mycena olivaceomarginata]|nr:hypothetical protein B0H14DRAFT_2658258 [Mycena olivaceomarginata]
MEPDSEAGGTMYKMAAGFMRKGKREIGVVESLKAIAFSSWLNLLLLFIPIAWVAHFGNEHDAKAGDLQKTWKFQGTFVLCFLAIIPLEKLFDYGGEQMAFYLGEDLGDLLVVTLNNSVKLCVLLSVGWTHISTVEATLAIILLKKCELKLLQPTVVGVVLLHLLLIPGVAFVIGCVMTLLLPAAFFAALNHGSSAAPEAESFTNDTNRHVFLQMSRRLAVILLTLAPEALKERAIEIQNAEPEVNQWVCIGMLTVMIGIMAATAEWVVWSHALATSVPLRRCWFRWIRGQCPPPAEAKANAGDKGSCPRVRRIDP